jgi:hypothetical protein
MFFSVINPLGHELILFRVCRVPQANERITVVTTALGMSMFKKSLAQRSCSQGNLFMKMFATALRCYHTRYRKPRIITNRL